MPDSYAPDGGQRIDANGLVSYEFEGRIRAQGLDLDAGHETQRLIRWIRTSDGAVIAQLYGYEPIGGGDQHLSLTVRKADLAPGAQLPTGVELASNPAKVSVFAAGTGNQVLLVDEDGYSGVLRTVTPGGWYLDGVHVLNTGSLASGASSTVDLAHNLNRDVYPLVARRPLDNGPLDTAIGWGFAALNPFTLRFWFRNNGPSATAQADFLVFLMVVMVP